MKTELLWKLLFRTLIFALGCTSSYLLAHLFGLPKGSGWILIILSGVMAFRVKVPLTDLQENFVASLQKSIKQETKKTDNDRKEKREYEKDNIGLEDQGIQRNQSSGGALCLVKNAAIIYRDIFEPLLQSKHARLSNIGLLANEVVYWLVSQGDIQSVVSKFDIKDNKNTDIRYEALKKISLYDHSFNTALHAFKIAHTGHIGGGHPTSAYLAAAAGLMHDIGKHHHFFPMINGKLQYQSSHHPMYSVEAILYFIKRGNLNESLLQPIIDAVAKHHQDNVWDQSISASPPLPWIVQQADYAARQDEMQSMQGFKKSLSDLSRKSERSDIIVDESGSVETIKVQRPNRPLNLSKAVPVPSELRDRKTIETFLREVIGDNVNRYRTQYNNLDLETDNPVYECFTYGNDLLIRMSFIEKAWEEFALQNGFKLKKHGEKFPMQGAVKGLLQYLDHIEPGLVQRALLPSNFVFIQIQVRQGIDRWSKNANYIPLNLPVFLHMTGLDMQELEKRKTDEDDLAGKNFLGRICGWRKV